ncbi:hypothetical protein KKA85_11350, partial [bacterium]|nr:hypothetical protein [bacterium]
MTPLAVVWTRPETVRDDIVRVLAMSGYTATPGEVTAVIDAPGANRRGPGAATSPWQVEGALAAVAAHGGGEPSRRIT